MMQFYETYRGLPKLAPLVRVLSWTHLLIMSRSKRDEEREFYLRLCVQENGGVSDNWSGSLPVRYEELMRTAPQDSPQFAAFKAGLDSLAQLTPEQKAAHSALVQRLATGVT
jgi:hypothetical protein